MCTVGSDPLSVADAHPRGNIICHFSRTTECEPSDILYSLQVTMYCMLLLVVCCCCDAQLHTLMCCCRSFLQFSVTSHWPQGVKLCEEKLSIPNGASSEPIQVPVPEVGVLYNVVYAL